MIKQLFSLFLFLRLFGFCHVMNLYGMAVDDLFSTMIGPLYKVKNTAHTLPSKAKVIFQTTPSVPTKPTANVTIDFTEPTDNRTLKEFSHNKVIFDIEALIHNTEGTIPDFGNDDFEAITRRFDSIHDKTTERPALREAYYYHVETWYVPTQKKKVLEIMAQFVYETRYKLAYPQSMRAKYQGHLKYRLGYCFALLRNLKQQQYVIYSAMERNKYRYADVFLFVKMYEKVVRLDVDVKDLIEYMKRLEAERRADWLRRSRASMQTTTTRTTEPGSV